MKIFSFTDDWKKIMPAVIVAAGVIAYVNSLSAPFLFDDHVAIVGNRMIGQFWPIVIGMRLIVDLSFKLNYSTGMLNVADYHVTNVVIHVLAGLSLYGIVRRTLALPYFGSTFEGASRWLGIACASLWVAHPLQTESVTYICQRYEAMMGLFFLLTLYCFVRAQTSRHGRSWYSLSLASCVIGMGTKEVMAMTPIIVFVYDYMFVSSSFIHLLRTRWKFHLAMFLTCGILAMLILSSIGRHMEKGIPFATIGLSRLDYFLTEVGVIVHYMKLSVFPRDLCLDYLWPPSVHPGEIVPPMIFLSLLGLGTVWAVWRRRAVGFLGVWFFVILAPTSSFMPLGDAAFEHRMYLPLAAIVVLLVVGGYLLLEKIVRYCRSARCIALIRTAEIAGIVGLLSLLVFTTIQRNEVYRSNEAMWRDVLAKSHKNVRAMTALIDSLLTKAEYREAEDLSRRLLEQIEADRKPNPSGYILCMASFYSSAAHNQLGFALLSQGRASDAITHLRHVILVSSNDVIARHNLGLALWLVGRKDEAIQELDIALNMAPDSGTIHTLMAYFLSWSGRHGEAIKHGRRAIEIDAGDIAAGVQLAWLLATCPDDKIRNGAEALALAESICKQTDHQSVRALDVLAAAYAETGRFDDAVATARCAMKLASERIAAGSDVSDVVGEIGAQADRAVELGAIGRRIELYEKGKPFREP